MMWVEILSRHHEVLARYRVDADEARIGRAYDNDVVLDDPFVAAHHALVFRASDGALIAEDLKSANGLHDEQGRRVVHLALDGQRPFRIGRTLLRVRDAAFAVPAERHEAAPTRNGRTALVLAVIVVAATLLELWLAQTEEWRASTWLAPLLVYAALILAWSTGWALLSRLFSGAARFTTHLAIALATALVSHLYDWATDVGVYSFASRTASEYAYVGAWVIVGTAIFLHLLAIGPRHLAIKAGTVAAIVAAAVAVHTLFQLEARHQGGQRAQAATLLPPALRLREPRDANAFLGGVEALREPLDRARSEEPTTPSLFESWFED
jgi:hypothetical protein